MILEREIKQLCLTHSVEIAVFKYLQITSAEYSGKNIAILLLLILFKILLIDKK